MRYAMTIAALASGVAMLAATQFSASAAPTFNLKSTSGLVQPVRAGGGVAGAEAAEVAVATWAAVAAAAIWAAEAVASVASAAAVA